MEIKIAASLTYIPKYYFLAKSSSREKRFSLN